MYKLKEPNDKLIKNLDLSKVDDNIEIFETSYDNSKSKINCKCKKCGYTWVSRVSYIRSVGLHCIKCAKEKRLEEYEKNRRECVAKKVYEVASERNYEIVDIVFRTSKITDCRVKFYNKNIDRNGNEYGETELGYYEFIKSVNPKNTMYEYLAVKSDEWVEKVKKIHPEYCYTKTKYVNCHKSVIITCPIHGDFNVSPKEFIKPEYKCFKCKQDERHIQLINEVKEKLIRKFGNEYEFEIPENFSNIKSNIILICQKHGRLEVNAYNLLKNGKGCPKCIKEKNGINRRITFKEFVERAEKIHCGKYKYNEKLFRNNSVNKTEITCPIHGTFEMSIKMHLNGHGCPKCHGIYKNETERQYHFIDEVKKIHGDKYDLSEAKYIKSNEKVKVICHKKDEFGNEHGEFWATPHRLIGGYGCKKCYGNFMNRNLFILKGKEKHNDKYDYTNVEYINNKTKIRIICPEHGEFLQTPNSHLNGGGCPFCKTSHLETDVNRYLKKSGKLYIYQYRNKEIFGQQSVDFYIPSLKLAIECQGEQHFISNFYKKFYTENKDEHLKYLQNLDAIKKQRCIDNGIKLIYFLDKKFIKFLKDDDIYVTNEKDLIDYINKQK